MNLATAGLDRLLMGGDWRYTPHLLTWPLPLALLVTMFLDAGALFEKNGWRGYAPAEPAPALPATDGRRAPRPGLGFLALPGEVRAELAPGLMP